MVSHKKLVSKIFVLSSILFFSTLSQAEVLFEGYSKISSGNVHVGYAISRYEFDAKKKQFISTTFLKTGELGGNITESLSAIATEDLKPISYHYTTMLGNQPKIIDAKFEKSGKMVATIKTGSKIERINKDLPKGTFLSTFLAYLMLRSKEGLKVENKYDYQAIAEEDGSLSKGFALIKAQEEFNGMKAMKVINEFKNSKFISYINDRGEVYAVKSPAQSISTELVAQPSVATGSFPVPSSLLKVLFGDVPLGQVNEVAKAYQKEKAVPPAATENVPGKKSGVPAGAGLQIKNEAPPEPETPPAGK